MASYTKTELLDDFDGSPAQRTIVFSYEGHAYEIDLSEANAQTLDANLAPYIEQARKVSDSAAGRSGRRSSGSNADNQRGAQEIRAWAAANGIEVNLRGRVPKNIREQYANRHISTKEPASAAA